MAEIPNTIVSPYQNDGYDFDRGYALLELHRLVAIVLASESFSRLITLPLGEGFDPIFKLQEVEEAELQRLLLTVATLGRVKDDRRIELAKKFEANGVSIQPLNLPSCGRLIVDLSRPNDDKPLTLREAFNKIIHASGIKFDIENHGLNSQHINPTIYVEGIFGQKRWKATIELIEFARAYVEHLYQMH
jgi:hypothetical protein